MSAGGLNFSERITSQPKILRAPNSGVLDDATTTVSLLLGAAPITTAAAGRRHKHTTLLFSQIRGGGLHWRRPRCVASRSEHLAGPMLGRLTASEVGVQTLGCGTGVGGKADEVQKVSDRAANTRRTLFQRSGRQPK